MDERPPLHQQRLQRLTPEHYRGRAFVHWTMAIDGRKTGWLDPLHHARLRELLCHSLARHRLVCPAYCLMPDHAHFLLCGFTTASDQRLAIRDLRTGWNRLLTPHFQLQLQAHDHVLREHERVHDSFQTVAHYIFDNPQRAGIIDEPGDWSYCGALVPGYPELDPRSEDFWLRFWRLWNHLAEAYA